MQPDTSIKHILEMNREFWDRPDFPSSARKAFQGALKCGTAALGYKVYASEREQKLVAHTCGTKACSSCGHRRTLLWQREQRASLPNIPFVGMVFTMPDVLWPIFRRNRGLLNHLPALGAMVLQPWAKEEYGTEHLIMVIRHTFGRHMGFNPHLHILVSSGGLHESDGTWAHSVPFIEDVLMSRWKLAVTSFLRDAYEADTLDTELSRLELKTLLNTQHERWWSIKMDPCVTKEHFLRYAARYIRRPPLAQYRILSVSEHEITFWTDDHRKHRRVVTKYTPQEFVNTLAEHMHDHYTHSVRYFGLLAPRAKSRKRAMIFALLGLQQQKKPSYLPWRYSIKAAYGIDPLLDSHGQEMKLIGRRPAE